MTAPLDPAAIATLQYAATFAIDFRSQRDGRPQRPLTTVCSEMLKRIDAARAGRRFFGWLIGSSHSVGFAADRLTSAWGQNAGKPLAT